MITLKTFDRTPSLAELKVSYRRRPTRGSHTEPTHAVGPTSCERYLRRVWNADTIELREDFVLLCLNGANDLLGWVRLCTGGFNHTQVDIRLLLGVALQTASSAIVIAHNHPSGRLVPSADDVDITRRVAAACEVVGIRLLDHIILSRDGFYSFAEGGGW